MSKIMGKRGLAIKLPALFLLVALVPLVLISIAYLSETDQPSELPTPMETNLSAEDISGEVSAGFWIAPYGGGNLSSEMVLTLRALAEPARTLRIAVGGDDAVSVGYVGTSNGILIFWPDITETIQQISSLDHRDRPWYLEAERAGETIWTEPYLETDTNTPAITCATPIYRGGVLAGVAGMDVSLDEINRDMTLHPDLYTFLSDENGVVVMRPVNLPEQFLWDELLVPGSLLESDNSQLVQIVDKMVHGQTGSSMIHLNKGECRIAYAPLPTVGWSLGIVSGDAELAAARAAQYDEHFHRIETQNDIVALSATESLRDLVERMEETPVDEDMQEKEADNHMAIVIIAAFLVSALLAGAAGLWTGRDIATSLDSIIEALDRVGEGDLDAEVEVKSSDEIGDLGEAFNQMAAGLRVSQTEKVFEHHAESKGLAEEIQYILAPERTPLVEGYEVAVFSSGDIGGHFYDVFDIADDRSGVVMAEVSGEGVPAALLAFLSKNLIRATFRRYGDPAKALRESNLEICENAKSGMLVTCFCGILDPDSNLMEYANAGHIPPFVVSSQGFVDTLTGGGIALGALDQVDLEMEGWMIDPGDVLVIYNDGIIEVANESGENFGTERLIDQVRENRDRTAPEILETVERAIRVHAGYQTKDRLLKGNMSLLIVKRCEEV